MDSGSRFLWEALPLQVPSASSSPGKLGGRVRWDRRELRAFGGAEDKGSQS